MKGEENHAKSKEFDSVQPRKEKNVRSRRRRSVRKSIRKGFQDIPVLFRCVSAPKTMESTEDWIERAEVLELESQQFVTMQPNNTN